MHTRIALVTGASRGIGAAVAQQLAGPNTHVLVNYREKAKRANAVVDGIRAAGGPPRRCAPPPSKRRALRAKPQKPPSPRGVPRRGGGSSFDLGLFFGLQ